MPITVLSSESPPLRGDFLCGGRERPSVTGTFTPTRTFRSCALMRMTVLHTVSMLMIMFVSGSVMNMFKVVVCEATRRPTHIGTTRISMGNMLKIRAPARTGCRRCSASFITAGVRDM